MEQTPQEQPPERKPHAKKTYKPWRRANGDGSIFPVEVKDRYGQTKVRFRAVRTIEIGSLKKRIIVQAATHAEAREKLDERIIEERVAYGLEPIEALRPIHEHELLTVEKCMSDWMDERRKEGDLKPASLRMYDARIRNHILPVFADQPVRTLTYQQLKDFFRETLPAKGLGVSSVHQTFVAFKSALNHYQRDRIITAHPMVGIAVPKAKPKSIADKTAIRRASYFLNEYLLKEAVKVNQEARWFLGLLGLRQGEVLGMTDDSLITRGTGDRLTYRVHVKQQLQHISAEHGCGVDNTTGKWNCGEKSSKCPKKKGQSHFVLSSLKTENGHREIVITKRTWEMLSAHRAEQQERRKTPQFKPVDGLGLDQLLFTREDGKPIYAQRDRAALTKLIANISNLPPNMTVHTLRHVATTRLISGEANREDLIAMMGWSPKNADAQIATYSSADMGRQASKTTTGYIEGFYPTDED